MRLAVLFVLLCAATIVGRAEKTFSPEQIAAYCREQDVKETQELRDLLKDVDVLLFEEPVAVAKKIQTKGLVTDKKMIQSWVDAIRVENDPTQAIIGNVEGIKEKQIIILDSTCQCWGSFTVSAFRNKKLVVTFTAFHRKWIQSSTFTHNLSAESFILLYKMAQDSIPDAVTLKEANQ